MPQSCPHCGTALPGVVDAFCPECREDLSATPEEAQQTAEETYRILKGTVKAAIVPEAAQTPEGAKATSAGWALMLTIIGVAGLVTSVLKGEWGVVPVALAFLAVGGLWLRGEYRSRVVRTSVTGKGKTSKGSEQAK
jgi:hypothetical protein